MFDCYIINLESATDRWNATAEPFLALGLNVIRLPAIEGKDLTFPLPDFASWRYFFWYGRKMTPNKVACYFSHIKALKTFLETDKEYAMICEDDVFPLPELMDVLKDAMRYSGSWDLLRLNGIRATKGIRFAALSHGYHLCCDLKTKTGNGAKVVNRYAAETIIKKCLPMRLPHDVTLFYDWPIGIREVTVQPFPIQLNAATRQSSIGMSHRYPFFHPAILRYPLQLTYRLYSRVVRYTSRFYWALRNYFCPPRPQ